MKTYKVTNVGFDVSDEEVYQTLNDRLDENEEHDDAMDKARDSIYKKLEQIFNNEKKPVTFKVEIDSEEEGDIRDAITGAIRSLAEARLGKAYEPIEFTFNEVVKIKRR
jgi:hypothetical protein